jgi:large subunit ribosomal protein L6
MSRIGKKPVAIPEWVTIDQAGQEVKAKGPLGELVCSADEVDAKSPMAASGRTKARGRKLARAMWGMSRTMVATWSPALTTGFTKQLEITASAIAPRCRATISPCSSATATTSVYPIPDVHDRLRAPTEIVVTGASTSRRLARSRPRSARFRPPEPYKGKGIKYSGRDRPPQGRQEEVVGHRHGRFEQTRCPVRRRREYATR